MNLKSSWRCIGEEMIRFDEMIGTYAKNEKSKT